MQLEPGFYFFQNYLTADDQQRLWAACRALAEGPVPLYKPTVRGGRKMSVGMLCLGRHWNGLTYAYEDRRSDFDGQPAPPIPVEFRQLAVSAAAKAGFAIDPDICIVNFYDSSAKLGVHQDKDESPASLAAGTRTAPVRPADP